MSLTILFRWDGQAAWPVSGWADLQKLPVNGPYLTATITQPRSPAHHRRTFALINAAYENWPDTHAFQPDSAEHLRAWLVIEAGHGKREYFRVKPTAGPNGISLLCAMVIKAGAKHKFPFYAADADKIVLRYADTLSWARVNQRAFAPLAAKIADIICVETGLTEQQLLPARDNEQAGGADMTLVTSP